ncbi:MAG: hypothetical protein KAT10_01155 [Sulfurimonas sp.]|nr:hypothetical protein [Sulfurimonas sp.]
MKNETEFIFQIIDVIFITIFVMIDIVKEFMPSVDIISGIILFILSLITVFLMIKLIEKKIIFKGMLLLILTFVFFALIKRVEVLNEVTAYISSLIVGILLLLAMAVFTSWDEDNEEYLI